MASEYDGERFRFARVDEPEPRLEFEAALPTDPAAVWVVKYEEMQPHSLIRGRGNRDLPVRGRCWIASNSGRVLASEFIAKDSEVGATVDVGYRMDPTIGQFVPVEMRERYSDRYGSRVDGIAAYSNFRRFQVSVEETLPPDSDLPRDHD